MWLPPLGLLGAHRFYLGHIAHGIGYFITAANGGLSWLFDLFYLHIAIRQANSEHPKEKTWYNALILWLGPTGILGFHRMYLESWGTAVFFFFTGGNCGLGWILDVFRIPSLIRDVNSGSQRIHPIDAYVLWLPPLGILGAHHVRLHRLWWALLYFFTAGLFVIGWVVDMVYTYFLVKRYNETLISDLESGKTPFAATPVPPYVPYPQMQYAPNNGAYGPPNNAIFYTNQPNPSMYTNTQGQIPVVYVPVPIMSTTATINTNM